MKEKIVSILIISSIILITSFFILKKNLPQISNQKVLPHILISPTIISTFIPTPSPMTAKQNYLILDVPFTVQAPFADWKNSRLQDGCEEASILMAMYWARNRKIIDQEAARDEILAISRYQENTFGEYRDTSAKDTAKWIVEGYYRYPNYEVKPVTSAENIINELDKGNLVVVPSDGQALGNPNFTAPGPERHMVVIRGYDKVNSQFITNDGGIRQGEGWKYNQTVLFNAVRDYETGYHVPITKGEKVMIVIKK